MLTRNTESAIFVLFCPVYPTLPLTASEGILEDLLETKELEDGKVDGGVETETTLVGTEGGVELNTVTAVDLEVALVVLPDNTELDDTLGDGSDVEGGAVLGVLLEEGGVLESVGQLCGKKSSQFLTPWRHDSMCFLFSRHTLVGLLELGLRGKVRHFECG